MAKIAMPIGEDFEDSEFSVPYADLQKHGHQVTVCGLKKGEILLGKRGRASAKIDALAKELDARDDDAVVIAGGYSPDHLRLDRDTVDLVRELADRGKLVAAVCHGPQLLIEADVVKGHTLTSWPSVRKDLQNAGALWIDQEVVEDDNFITSRKPEDLEAFCRAIEEYLE